MQAWVQRSLIIVCMRGRGWVLATCITLLLFAENMCVMTYVCIRICSYMFVYVCMHSYFYAKSTVNVPLKVGNYLCISFPLHSNAVQAIIMTDAIQDLWHMHLVL